MMVEGVVEVKGSVSIDTSDELKKLYQAARNARETSDTESALKHYENISAKDPDSWEALFYLVALKTNSIKNSEIASAAINVSNCLPKVFELLSKDNNLEKSQKIENIEMIIAECYSTALWLTEASHNFYKLSTKGNGVMALTGVVGAISSISSTGNAIQEDSNRCLHIANIMICCGNSIENIFDMTDESYKEYAVLCWKKGLELSENYKTVHGSSLFNNESITRFRNKIGSYSKNAQNHAQTSPVTQASPVKKTDPYMSSEQIRQQIATYSRQRKLHIALTIISAVVLQLACIWLLAFAMMEEYLFVLSFPFLFSACPCLIVSASKWKNRNRAISRLRKKLAEQGL